jgi:hypothetical protein
MLTVSRRKPGRSAWRLRRAGAAPSLTIGQCLNGGLGWLEVECNRCKTKASLPLDAICRPRDTPIWKLEASLKCRRLEGSKTLSTARSPTNFADGDIGAFAVSFRRSAASRTATK